MNNELAVTGSELPVLQTKETYKYLAEVSINSTQVVKAKISYVRRKRLWKVTTAKITSMMS